MSSSYTMEREGEIKIHTIIWTIPDIQLMLENKAKIHTTKVKEFRTTRSKELTEDKIMDTQFELKLRFYCDDYIELCYLSSNPVFLLSLRSVTLTKCGNESINLKSKGMQMIQDNKWQHIHTFTKLYHYTDSGHFRLKFEFRVPNYKASYSYTVPASQLSNDLRFLLNNGLYSDVTIKSADQLEYKVHRGVLASRSAVLKAHFEHNTTECTTNIVETSLEAEVLREVLTFIYSDKAPRIDEMAEKLLAAADYYQLGRLKSLCEVALNKKLTVENAIETLQLADLHMATNLRVMTLEFIKDGRAKLITKADSWANVKCVDIIKSIYQYIVADDYDVTYCYA